MMFVAAYAVVFLTGCETMDEFMGSFQKDELKKGVHYRLSVHEIVKYPRAKKLERALPMVGSDDKVWVNMNSFIDSRRIKNIKLLDVEGQPGMKNFSLELDERGIFQWLQLSNSFIGTRLALVCDGKVLKLFTINERSTEESKTVTLEGPFDFVNAGLVKKYAKHNYKFYNEF